MAINVISSSGVQCVSPDCDYPIQPGWSFCPACGCDNRAPRDKRKIGSHRHEFAAPLNFCVHCGEPAGEPYLFNYRWRMIFLLTAWSLAFFAVLGAVLIQVGHAQPQTTLGRWVSAWYERETRHSYRRRSSLWTDHYTSTLGIDVTWALIIVAVVLAVIGLRLLYKMPFSRNVYDEDDKSFWWRGFWRF